MILADIIRFLGRLHPLVLHLPIGMFFLLALYMLFAKQKDPLLIRKGLLVNIAFTAITIIFGLILAGEGGYDPDTLQYHKLSGIGFVCAQAILLLIVSRPYGSAARYGALGTSTLLLVVTGHLGGVLTHGGSYLTEYLPRLQSVQGKKVDEVSPVGNLDSARIFGQIVYPVLEKKCVSCHNPMKQRGGLDLTSYASMLAGGEHGAPVIPGDPGLSDLIRRVRLPEKHIAAMPPQGSERLTEDELTVLSWWIESGAPDTIMVGQHQTDTGIMAILQRLYGSGNNVVFRVSAPALDSMNVAEANEAGWMVKPVAAGSNALLIKAQDSEARPEAIRDLVANIYELDISDMPANAKWADLLSECINLSLLNLTRCNQVDRILEALPVGRLRVLILNETDLRDLNALAAFPSLERVYLLDSQVPPEGLAAFVASNPEVEVIAKHFAFESPG